jgi:LPS sulfotransferase NodH
MAPVYIVSGLPRSGTSLMMQMLAAGGIEPFTDNERTADSDNPRGYLEYERVKRLPEGDTAWLASASGKVVKVISALLPFLPATYEYRVLFMHRELEEVLASQRVMLARRGEATPTAAEEAELRMVFTAHLRQTENWLNGHSNVKWLRVPYSDLVQQPATLIPAIVDFCEQPLQMAAMQAAVDQNLYRNKK